MHHSIRTLALSVAVGSLLAGTSCGSKQADPQAQAQTAILSGQVSPAGSVTAVTATDASGKAFPATLTSAGAYTFSPLALGSYTLTFISADGYTTPAPVTVTLGASGTSVPATTVAVARATASFQVDGAAVNAEYIFEQTISNDRFLTFTVSPGGAPGPTLNFIIGGLVPIVKTYNSASDEFSANYLDASYNTYYTDRSTQVGASNGTLVVTAVNSTLRRFSGTFSFVLGNPTGGSISGALLPGTPLTKTITKGVFTNLYY